MHKERIKFSPEMLESLREMGESGMTVQAIADKTGIPLRSLQDLFYDRKNNMPYKRIHTKAKEADKNAFIRARERMNVSREAVEDETGLTVTTIYNWEHGRLAESVKKIVKLARFYGTTVEALVGDPDA